MNCPNIPQNSNISLTLAEGKQKAIKRGLTLKLNDPIMKQCWVVNNAMIQFRNTVQLRSTKSWVKEIVVFGNLLNVLKEFSHSAVNKRQRQNINGCSNCITSLLIKHHNNGVKSMRLAKKELIDDIQECNNENDYSEL